MAAVSVAALGFAAPALAKKPTTPYENFGNCPTKVSGVNLCIFAQSNSGEFKIKKTTVPITKTITLQGGVILNESTGAETWVNAANGAETLSKTPETVPGGLLKILPPEFFPEPLKKIFNEFINKGITGVTASTELVGNITINRTNLLSESGVALTLPVRVHLENEFLGPGCYVGSKAHPVTLELTTGTTSPPLPNEPIKGSVGEPEILEGGNLVILKKNSLVNNTFAAPEAEGCGSQILFGIFTGLIDDAVNSELELPSAAGHNTAILTGTLENAVAAAVVASEK
ncbi:MAG TPA: hypothetical protein VIJ33_05510 [Solirubrobacteraceae bacterium]